MSSFCVWTIVVILYQTVISVIISWVTLGCKLRPQFGEPRELTLMKLLYLYDPEACVRRQFYNYTVSYVDEMSWQTVTYCTIVWPETNYIAATFRTRVKLWMSLHIVWLGLALVNASQGKRVCAFYAVQTPLTIVGLALLVLDIVHTVLFLRDAPRTSTERKILDYISSTSVLNSINQSAPYKPELPEELQEDTTWVALLFAYASCRGVVQWLLNFWIVQDNFLEGFEYYRSMMTSRKEEKKAQYFNENDV